MTREFKRDELMDPPENAAEMTRLHLGFGALATLVGIEGCGDPPELDRFVLEESHDPEVIDTAIFLGVLGEKQDGAVVYDTLDEISDVTYDDVMTDDGEWDLDWRDDQ